MSMTSETEVLKTNEFLRRRKLRLQQVREQSKDIAKKIRQRTKVERLRQIEDLDSKKKKEYIQCQEKLVKRLEQLYAQGIKSVGDSHKKATEEKHNGASPQEKDLSKLRGKEAVAELRKRRQEKLDMQKKILDRKLLAREAANEISREKSTTIANKLQAKSSTKISEETDHFADCGIVKKSSNTDDPKVAKNDMATQWDCEELPNEWEPTIPALSLPKDDKESIKDNPAPESKLEKSKRLDLFALSDEMPSSLRGGITMVPEQRPASRPSLNLVSEYLQSRVLRLRETDTTDYSSKKQQEELHSIKQTILHSRSSKIAVKNADKSSISSVAEANNTKKNSVTMYNHATRDSRDIQCGDSRLVVCNLQENEDAYAQALKEATNDSQKEKEHQKKLHEMRNKVAMTKQTVEKEYNDTMSFLKSLPKEKSCKHERNAHLAERRQRMLKVSRQQKLQQEFNKIERECRKSNENADTQRNSPGKSQLKSKSPITVVDNEFDTRDVQYSWMPVPESDGNLAIHTIPNTIKEGKSGNTVKFSTVDSYHEYRSRHKHTPPTKDTNPNKPINKKVVETVLIQNEQDESTDCSSISSDTSSVHNLNIDNNHDKNPKQNLSEAEKIIIYKILDSKQGKKDKERKKKKLIDEVAQVLKSMERKKSDKSLSDSNNNKDEKLNKSKEKDTGIPLDQVDEGVYKVVNEKGDNIASLYTSDDLNETKPGRLCCYSKELSNDHQSEKGTILHSGGGDLPETRVAYCETCKRGCSNNIKPKSQPMPNLNITEPPSAATSTSSFKTATTDKAQGAPPDGGYIKLLGDNGHEAGKIYFGANNILKDDAYEVVIQLRKKETARLELEKEKTRNLNVNKDICGIAAEEKTKSSSVEELATEPGSSKTINRTHPVQEKEVNSPRPCSETFLPENLAKDNNVREDENSSNHASTDSSNGENPCASNVKSFQDKGVYTPSQLSYAIPSDVPKIDPVSRPATSTYTQTTMESPNPRPVFIHMSSSTSTAYMSPPEMVLPSFLRQDHEFQDGMPQMRQTRFDHVNCARKRCRCYKSTSFAPCRKGGFSELSTPPNTARNKDENSDTNDNAFKTPVRKAPKKKYKCESRNSANDLKCYRKGSKALLHKLSSRNLVMRVSSSNASSLKNKANNLHCNKGVSNTNLNPTLKKYVNRLLALNREGIKAIEVANQECSSVSTPGSSIIEVPRNLNEMKSEIDNKISLEQIKNILKQQILDEFVEKNANINFGHAVHNKHKSRISLHQLPKKKSIHKIKSLNISKRVLKQKKACDKTCSTRNIRTDASSSLPSSTRDFKFNKPDLGTGSRSKSSPTPRQMKNGADIKYKKSAAKIGDDKNKKTTTRPETNTNDDGLKSYPSNITQPQGHCQKVKKKPLPFPNATTSTPDSGENIHKRHMQDETNLSTQTSQDLDSEINLIKLAEDKLQNMEKIADLTEKCTKRLSNLAKVLEEVRRNKSLAYSQISTSDTASDSDHKSDKNVCVKNVAKQVDPVNDMHSKTDFKSSTPASNEQEKEAELMVSSEYISFLTDIPKPAEFKYPIAPSPTQELVTKSKPLLNTHVENFVGKRRDKPPPALSRIHLKHGQDVVPHELSTVIEVDSPMSVKFKNHSSRNDTKQDVSDMSYRLNSGNKDHKNIDNPVTNSTSTERRANPDLLQSNTSTSKLQTKISSTDSSDDSKIEMMDLKQFNELMLQPFISIQEFAKQCGDVGMLDDGSNLDEIPKDEINEEFSSLHSDGSLPDVIAELLKRNIITEPFKFDTMSNVNSTTVSSESTLSVLALSKAKKDKKKSSLVVQNKENISETSDTLSISSNPDLENAFKKLGMGWASSTLKKTKERLALSSSTNTSSSSSSQFKLKCLNNQDIPALVTDSVSSAKKPASKRHQDKKSDTAHVEQQTSLMNSMTVREFLTNELAKKITFTNKSNRNDTGEEFVSLFETKMPEEIKNMSQTVREERSIDSLPSGQNRARTSTPVQIFKSMTYHSSSSSNMSNGLFSNADDLSSVKVTSNSIRNHSTSDKDDLTIPNCSLKTRKGASDCSKSE